MVFRKQRLVHTFQSLVVFSTSIAFIYAGCFTLLTASNRRLHFFSGDIVPLNVVFTQLMHIFWTLPATGVTNNIVTSFSLFRLKSKQKCCIVVSSFFLVLTVVAILAWHIIAFRSPKQFFEFVGAGVRFLF